MNTRTPNCTRDARNTPLITAQEDTFQDYMHSDRGVAAAYDLDMDVMDTSMDGAELGDSVEPAIDAKIEI